MLETYRLQEQQDMAQERFFKNSKTWKQISTNVPPEMHRALKRQLKDEYTMSHLLRDMIAESDVMKNGLPQPIWSLELMRNIASLRKEVAALHEELTQMKEDAARPPVSELSSKAQTLQFAPDFSPSYDFDGVPEEDIQEEPAEESFAPPVTPRKSISLFGRISEMLGVTSKTA